MKEWFLSEVERHGEQYRRVVRYLKAFRDWQWPAGGPASFLLMAAHLHCSRTESAGTIWRCLDIVEKLPGILRDGVYNPVDLTESLTARLGKKGVDDAATKFENLEKYLRGAVNASDSAQACAWMIHQFGNRFPNEPSRVKASTVAATVLATPATAMASPLVGRTQAG